ncbi:hypothetical protein [Maribacter sp. ACAM166]|uniref:hypothetical protein n=1 Tax=Maribacter sp. ACAM166 TaxID=2508996 RepID=UPI0010FD02D2|nr:hypothetical protein [Maribacter sp. ACAM166]TLP74030.1 hypothetical protein ES765_16980 [Maribacter sp. ACAM166]
MKSKPIKIFKIFLFLGTLLSIVFFSSCSRKITLDEYVTKELEKNIRQDSLIYGVHFGMTGEEFQRYCTGMNQKKIFMPNPSGTNVRLEISNGFGTPVYLNFFPVLIGKSPIRKVNASLKYKKFSYYEEKHKIEILVNQAITYFEEGYGGNRFFSIPHENKLLKFMYVKIDGNRKILLKPTFEGQELEIEFEDLSNGKDSIKE